MDSQQTTFVLAPGRHTFLRWCEDAMVSPNDPAIRYVSQPQDVQGVVVSKTDRIVDLGGRSDLLRELEVRRV